MNVPENRHHVGHMRLGRRLRTNLVRMVIVAKPPVGGGHMALDAAWCKLPKHLSTVTNLYLDG